MEWYYHTYVGHEGKGRNKLLSESQTLPLLICVFLPFFSVSILGF